MHEYECLDCKLLSKYCDLLEGYKIKVEIKEGTEKNCPKCDDPMQLQANVEEYYGKPWWCHSCQWQFSEEELA